VGLDEVFDDGAEVAEVGLELLVLCAILCGEGARHDSIHVVHHLKTKQKYLTVLFPLKKATTPQVHTSSEFDLTTRKRQSPQAQTLPIDHAAH
jgi:hypothetical protein